MEIIDCLYCGDGSVTLSAITQVTVRNKVEITATLVGTCSSCGLVHEVMVSGTVVKGDGNNEWWSRLTIQ